MHSPLHDPAPSAAAGGLADSRAAYPELRRIQDALDRLERQKRDLIADLAQWTGEARRFRPDAQSWSAVEVMDHLVKVECESLALIKSRLSERIAVTMRERVARRIVFAVMWSPLRVKVPPSVQSVRPSVFPDEEAVLLRWQEVRKEMRLLIEGLQPDQLSWGLFRHPVSGSMRIQDALAFLSVHMKHHGYQLRRLRAAFGRRRA